MHRVEEISLLKAEVEALAAERDEAMKVLGKAVGGQGRAVTEVLALRRQLHHADGRIIDLTNRNDALQELLAECQGTLERARTACRVTNEARENLLAANRGLSQELNSELHTNGAAVVMLRNDVSAANREIAELREQTQMVVEAWRQLKAVHAEKPENHAVALALVMLRAALNMRPEVLAMAWAMERKLRKHDGDWGVLGWKDANSEHLEHKLLGEIGELITACHTGGDARERTGEAADVANMAMMLADIWGGLDGIEAARAALASGAGEKAAAVIAAVREWDQLYGMPDVDSKRGLAVRHLHDAWTAMEADHG